MDFFRLSRNAKLEEKKASGFWRIPKVIRMSKVIRLETGEDHEVFDLEDEKMSSEFLRIPFLTIPLFFNFRTPTR
jgi:hypothetical protein